MAGGDPVEEVRERTRLIDVVSRYVSLKRSGGRHWGLCPFHAEKTASFSVVEDQGFFHCFGCGAHGDVFKFVQQIEKVDFREALERLAKEAGVEIERDPAARKKREGRERLLELNARAAAYFARCLSHERKGAAARRYLEDRGVDAEAVRRFRIGFAPPAGLARALQSAKVRIEDAESVGLVGRRGNQWYDRFRDRIMFPITDLSGRTIAFGGRLLGEGQGPKYLNSPESAVFHKRRALFGLAEGRDAIREKDAVIVVEGYLDVIALAQAGIRNVVAPLGTALTAEQIRLLRRFTDRVIVLFDGDAAGAAAASRSFPVFAEAGLFADAIFLPGGQDPDTFVRTSGAAALEALLAEPMPLVDHYLRTLAPRDAPLAARLRAAETVAELVGRCGNEVFAGLLAHRASQALGLAEEQLLKRGRRERSRAEPSAPAAEPGEPPGGPPAPSLPSMTASECGLLEVLLARPEARSALPADIDERLHNDRCRDLVRRATAEGVDLHALLDQLPRTSRTRVLEALDKSDLFPDPEQIVRNHVAGIEREQAEAHIHALSESIREAEARGDDESLRRLLEEQNRLATALRRPPPD